MDVKKYLEEYKIQTADKLVSHIVELKRNTKPNLELVSRLASYLPIMHDNEILENSFKENRRENWFCNTSDEERVKRYVYLDKKGVKQNQTEQKAPVFTYCKVNKNALEALSLRALPSIERILSPCFTPAFWAGPKGFASTTTTSSPLLEIVIPTPS